MLLIMARVWIDIIGGKWHRDRKQENIGIKRHKYIWVIKETSWMYFVKREPWDAAEESDGSKKVYELISL